MASVARGQRRDPQLARGQLLALHELDDALKGGGDLADHLEEGVQRLDVDVEVVVVEQQEQPGAGADPDRDEDDLLGRDLVEALVEDVDVDALRIALVAVVALADLIEEALLGDRELEAADPVVGIAQPGGDVALEAVAGDDEEDAALREVARVAQEQLKAGVAAVALREEVADLGGIPAEAELHVAGDDGGGGGVAARGAEGAVQLLILRLVRELDRLDREGAVALGDAVPEVGGGAQAHLLGEAVDQALEAARQLTAKELVERLEEAKLGSDELDELVLGHALQTLEDLRLEGVHDEGVDLLARVDADREQVEPLDGLDVEEADGVRVEVGVMVGLGGARVVRHGEVVHQLGFTDDAHLEEVGPEASAEDDLTL